MKEINETNIRIKAQSEVMSVDCVVPEKKSLMILKQIRNNFIKLKAKYQKNNDVLKVNTSIHNPTLF